MARMRGFALLEASSRSRGSPAPESLAPSRKCFCQRACAVSAESLFGKGEREKPRVSLSRASSLPKFCRRAWDKDRVKAAWNALSGAGRNFRIWQIQSALRWLRPHAAASFSGPSAAPRRRSSEHAAAQALLQASFRVSREGALRSGGLQREACRLAMEKAARSSSSWDGGGSAPLSACERVQSKSSADPRVAMG